MASHVSCCRVCMRKFDLKTEIVVGSWQKKRQKKTTQKKKKRRTMNPNGGRCVEWDNVCAHNMREREKRREEGRCIYSSHIKRDSTKGFEKRRRRKTQHMHASQPEEGSWKTCSVFPSPSLFHDYFPLFFFLFLLFLRAMARTPFRFLFLLLLLFSSHQLPFLAEAYGRKKESARGAYVLHMCMCVLPHFHKVVS